MADSFVFYSSFLKAAERLDDKRKAEFLEAIAIYGLEGAVSEGLDPVVAALMDICIPTIDAAKKKRISGNKGGRPLKTNSDEEETNGYEVEKPMVSESENQWLSEEETNGYANQKPNVNVNVNVNDNVNGNVRKTFTPPSPSEVTQYCIEMGYPDFGNKFVDFYTSKGWLVGKSKMKDWKAAARSWASREKKEPEDELSKWLE